MKTRAFLAGAALVCASPALAADVPTTAEEVRPLLVGSAVPEVELPATDGGVVDLAAAARAQPTILIFYRGGW